MKTNQILGPLLALGTAVICAQTTTEKTSETTTNADGSTTRTDTTTTTFNPEVKTRVVKYFDTYKSEKYGLPPAWVTQYKIKEIPAAWRTTLSPGVVITEKERPYLVAASPELVKVLPAPTGGVRYYMAGRNVVAVDSNYKVVDALDVPSIQFESD